MQLNEMFPKEVTEVINGVEMKFRPMSAADKIWVMNEYGLSPDTNDKFLVEGMFRLAYRLLVDKTPYRAEKIEEINEYGESEVKIVGGWEKFVRGLTNADVISKVQNVVARCTNAGNPPPSENAGGASGE